MSKGEGSNDTVLQIEDSAAEPVLYKAQVGVRWRNRTTGQYTSAAAGTVVEFDEGDFSAPGQLPDRTLTSLEDVLARGLFVLFDPDTAGDVEHMSRDEMLHLLASMGAVAPGGEPWPHNTPAEDLRPAVQAALDGSAGGADAGPSAAGKRRGA